MNEGLSLSPRAGLRVIAAALVLVPASVNLQVPLYPAYASVSGLGAGATTLAFACYIALLLPVLVFAGGLSDRIGRKPPMALALLMALLATLIVIAWPRLETIAVARVCHGLAIALMAGAGTAWAAELNQRLSQHGSDHAAGARGSALVTIMSAFGFGAGAGWTGLELMWHFSLTPFSYFGFAAIVGLCLLLILFVPDGGGPAPYRSLVRIPSFAPSGMPSGFAITLSWSVVGVAITVMPYVLEQAGLTPWIGVATFTINGTGGLVQLWARGLSGARQLRLGLIILPIGTAMVTYAVIAGNVLALILGAAVLGSASHGLLYQGGLLVAAARAGADRARAASGFFIYAYVGLCVPVAGLGAISEWLGRETTLIAYAAATALISAILFRSAVKAP